MTSFFHAYDLRGIYEEEIGLDEAEQVGRAFGTYLDNKEALVGRDGRIHADDVSNAFMDGLESTGTDITYAGLVPTPIVYFGAHKQSYGGSAVVTASHNPPEYTGIKFCRSDGIAMSRNGGMAEIQSIYESRDFTEGNGTTRNINLIDDYISHVQSKVSIEQPLDVAVNYGNGATCEIGHKLLTELGCNVTPINDDINGKFPNHLPNPEDKEAQRQLMDAMDTHDLGILFDGDGDRAGFIYPGHGYIDGDQMLAVLSIHSLKEKKGDVIHGIRASRMVREEIERHGGDPVESKVGHTFISEALHDNPDAVFAGEVSGHFYYPLYDTPWDDGLFTAAVMCEITATTDLGETLDALPDYPVSPEMRIDCPHEAKQDVIEALKERYSDRPMSTLDGVKIEFEDGWTLIRPSNTEPKISVRVEADDRKSLEAISERVRSEVELAIENAKR